jgi:Tfp pilus assembly protein PilX
MKKPSAPQAGFITMIIMLLVILVGVIAFVFLRVQHAQH